MQQQPQHHQIEPEEGGGDVDEFARTKANEKKDKKNKRAEERRRQREAKKAVGAAADGKK